MDKKLAKQMKSMIHTEDFCKVKNDKLSDVGLTKDTIVYVAGTQVVPENEKDLYSQRIKFIVTPLIEGHIQPEGKMYLIDPRNIKKVSQKDHDQYYETMVEDFSEKEADEGGVEEEQGELFTTH